MKQGIVISATLLALAWAADGNAQTYTRTDVLTYADNRTLWVMGQPGAAKNVETNLVESETRYSTTTALPTETYAFGKLKLKAAYNTDGTLATVWDGNNFPTTFSGWKRGIPQTIRFPDNYTKLAVVDDLGLIRSVTDEVGAKTCYGYDAMGRINSITYTSETQVDVCDTSAYHATTITFNGGNAAAYGLPAGHWRQTTLTGNKRKTLLFDAQWRPVVEQHLDWATLRERRRKSSAATTTQDASSSSRIQ